MFPQESLKLKLGQPLGVHELCWFSHDRYSRAEELDQNGWEIALDSRSVALYFGDQRMMLDSDAVAEGLMASPVDQFLGKAYPPSDAFTEAISDASVGHLLADLLSAQIDQSRTPELSIPGGWRQQADFVKKDLLTQAAALLNWWIDPNGERNLVSPICNSCRSYVRQRNSAPETLPINVHLDADDETLVLAFREWLANVRREFGPTTSRTKWSTASMGAWISARVLQYLDIKAYALMRHRHITHAVMGRVLFPAEYDVDLAERCRKVVAPLAERLVSQDFLSHLGAHNRWRNKI